MKKGFTQQVYILGYSAKKKRILYLARSSSGSGYGVLSAET